MPKTPPRSHVLHLAETLINGDLHQVSGEKNRDVARTARAWNAYVGGVVERKLAEWLRTSVAQPQVTREEFVEALQRDVLDDILDSWDIAWLVAYHAGLQSTVDPTSGEMYAEAVASVAVGYDCNVEATGENWAEGELTEFAKEQQEERAKILAAQPNARDIMTRRAEEERARVAAIQAERAAGTTPHPDSEQIGHP